MRKASTDRHLPRQCNGCDKVIRSRFKRHEITCTEDVKGERWTCLNAKLEKLPAKVVAANKRRGHTDSEPRRDVPRRGGKFCKAGVERVVEEDLLANSDTRLTMRLIKSELHKDAMTRAEVLTVIRYVLEKGMLINRHVKETDALHWANVGVQDGKLGRKQHLRDWNAQRYGEHCGFGKPFNDEDSITSLTKATANPYERRH